MSSANVVPVVADPRSRIDALDANAQKALQHAETLISKIAAAKSGDKGIKRLARKVVSAANEVGTLLACVAELNPTAKVAVGLFQYLVRMELDHQENNEQIATVWHSMASMLYVLRYLSPIINMDDGLKKPLENQLKEVEETMSKFGEFTNIYYKYKSGIFRLCHSTEYKARLAGFVTSFTQQKQDLHQLISYHAAIETHLISGKLTDLSANMDKIISRLGKTTPEEQAAGKLIEQKGGMDVVIHDGALLTKVAKTLGEKLNGSLRLALQDDLDVLLSKNLGQFQLKLEGAQMQIAEAIENSNSSILRQLDAGPHELIEDEDVRAVWKEMQWRTSVKCRVFMDAVHDHFEIKFRAFFQQQQMAHQDAWTLPFLSKVMYHPAIGDAIDADGSGFISVHECNHFIRQRPKGWSLPQWLAFWAAIWFDNNVVYYDKIEDLLENIQEARKKTKKKNKDGIDYYMAILQFLKPIILDSLDSGIAENAQDDSNLEDFYHVQNEYMELEQHKVKEHLKQLVDGIEDESSLVYVIGTTRIELSIMCLLYVLLEHHQEVIVLAQKETLARDRLYNMGNTLITILLAFHKRMSDLVHGWKQQRKNVTLHIQCFAGGIFNGWYKESQKPHNALRTLKRWYYNLDDNDAESNQEAPDKINQLVNHASMLEARLNHIEQMLLKFTGMDLVQPAIRDTKAATPKKQVQQKQHKGSHKQEKDAGGRAKASSDSQLVKGQHEDSYKEAHKKSPRHPEHSKEEGYNPNEQDGEHNNADDGDKHKCDNDEHELYDEEHKNEDEEHRHDDNVHKHIDEGYEHDNEEYRHDDEGEVHEHDDEEEYRHDDGDEVHSDGDEAHNHDEEYNHDDGVEDEVHNEEYEHDNEDEEYEHDNEDEVHESGDEEYEHNDAEYKHDEDEEHDDEDEEHKYNDEEYEHDEEDEQHEHDVEEYGHDDDEQVQEYGEDDDEHDDDEQEQEYGDDDDEHDDEEYEHDDEEHEQEYGEDDDVHDDDEQEQEYGGDDDEQEQEYGGDDDEQEQEYGGDDDEHEQEYGGDDDEQEQEYGGDDDEHEEYYDNVEDSQDEAGYYDNEQEEAEDPYQNEEYEY